MKHFAKKEKGRYLDLYTNKVATSMCCNPDDKIIEVDVTVDETGEYLGWLKTGEEVPHFIYPKRVLIDICFPYGVDVAIKRGEGKIVKVKIKEL